MRQVARTHSKTSRMPSRLRRNKWLPRRVMEQPKWPKRLTRLWSRRSVAKLTPILLNSLRQLAAVSIRIMEMEPFRLQAPALANANKPTEAGVSNPKRVRTSRSRSAMATLSTMVAIDAAMTLARFRQSRPRVRRARSLECLIVHRPHSSTRPLLTQQQFHNRRLLISHSQNERMLISLEATSQVVLPKSLINRTKLAWTPWWKTCCSTCSRHTRLRTLTSPHKIRLEEQPRDPLIQRIIRSFLSRLSHHNR